MMEEQNHEIEVMKKDFVKNNLQFSALIDDIARCKGPLQLLDQLNSDGRAKMMGLRSIIERLTNIAETELVGKEKEALLKDVETFRAELNSAVSAFRRCNIITSCVIDKCTRMELLKKKKEEKDALKAKNDKQNLADSSGQVTDKLYSISRHLAETLQRSRDTVDALFSSSSKVDMTKDELDHQQQVIQQSGKLLGKYGRREFTDKALLATAFSFFLACVAYILQKRLF